MSFWGKYITSHATPDMMIAAPMVCPPQPKQFQSPVCSPFAANPSASAQGFALEQAQMSAQAAQHQQQAGMPPAAVASMAPNNEIPAGNGAAPSKQSAAAGLGSLAAAAMMSPPTQNKDPVHAKNGSAAPPTPMEDATKQEGTAEAGA
jgi:hypothetical protein